MSAFSKYRQVTEKGKLREKYERCRRFFGSGNLFVEKFLRNTLNFMQPFNLKLIYPVTLSRDNFRQMNLCKDRHFLHTNL